MSVHDTVAQKNFDPVLPPLPDDFEDELDEDSVKIVRLVKNKEPLVRERNNASCTNTVTLEILGHLNLCVFSIIYILVVLSN